MVLVKDGTLGERKVLQQYAVGVLAAVGAILLRLALDPVLGEQAPLLVLVMGVMVSAWYGGLGPGLLATALSTIAGTFLFVEPRLSLRVVSSSEAVRVLLFAGEGLLISLLCGALHHARERTAAGVQALAESEARFRLLVDNVKDYAIFLLDPAGHVSSWNEGAERIKGYRADEIIGRHLEMLYLPEDVERNLPMEHLRAAAAEGRVAYEGWRLRKDGSRFWADMVLSAVHDDGGTLQGFAKVTRDTTERREAEAERQRLYASAEAARAKAEMTSEQLRRLQNVSDAALAHLGLEALLQELLARIEAALSADTATILLRDPPSNMYVVRAARGLEEEVTREIGIRHGEGFAGRVAAEGRPILIDDLASAEIVSPILRRAGLQRLLGVPLVVQGEVIGVVHVGTRHVRRFTEDDTRLLQLVADRAALAIDHARLFEGQRQALQRLERLHAIDRAILSAQSLHQIAMGAMLGMRGQVPYGQALVLVENPRGRLELMAEPANYPRPAQLDHALLLALATEEVVVEDILGVAESEAASEPLKALGVLGAPGMRSVLVQPLQSKAETIGSLVLMAPEVGVFGTQHQQITREVADQLAIALQQAQLSQRLREYAAELEQRVAQRTHQLEEANAELESFAYVVAHDLRAPLRAVRGFAQILQEDYQTVLDQRGQQYTRRINDAATHMDALIQDLLAYSRLGHSDLQIQPTPLARVVAEVCAALDAEIKEQNAHVMVEPGLPAVVGHFPTLVQIVTNLLSNALKFVRGGVPAQVRISAEHLDGSVRLSVEDNGIGIAPHHQERIFHVFERLHGIESYPGTGVGLAIVRKGIERMGGRAGVESIEGQGSRFWIELPGVEEE